MGFEGSIQKWHFEEFHEGKIGRTVVLATDGLSDDVIPEKARDFCLWLLSLGQTEQRRTLPRRLRRELVNWPTPLHCDDKTMPEEDLGLKGRNLRGLNVIRRFSAKSIQKVALSC